MITADKSLILKVFEDVKEEDIIFKPYRHNVWSVGRNNESKKFANTVTISRADIEKYFDENSALPGIYQERVQKKHEIRVCFFMTVM